jgi:hypothetical protein
VPVIVTVVPPVTGPLFGEMLATVGAAAVTVKDADTAVPSTVTVAVPDSVATAVVEIAAELFKALAVEFVVDAPCTMASVAGTPK